MTGDDALAVARVMYPRRSVLTVHTVYGVTVPTWAIQGRGETLTYLTHDGEAWWSLSIRTLAATGNAEPEWTRV